MKNVYCIILNKEGFFVKQMNTGKIMNKTPYKFSQRENAEKYKYKLEMIEKIA
jgi:hypothetical protein